MSQSPSEDLKTSIQHADGAKESVYLDKEGHAKVLRKIDWRLLPTVSLLYLLSFLDRSNIGNAKVAGMEKDLHLVGLKYSIAAAVFYVPYCLGQVPSNIMLKFFRPSRWIPTIMVAWGLVMTLMCLVKTFEGLVVARIFLGFSESGLFPGVTFLLSFWYPRAERTKRIAIFFSAATVAGAFGGTLANFSYHHPGSFSSDSIGGLHGWQWIVSCFPKSSTMSQFPDTASFLTDNERRYHVELLRADSQNLATHYDFRFVLQALQDYKTYLQFSIFVCLTIPGNAITLFTPTIINELGFSAANAQLLSVPPYAVACVATILVGMYSDKYQCRGPFVIMGAAIAIVGYIVLDTQTHPGASYVGAILAATGIFPAIPVVISWVTSNAGGDVKRGVALAMVNGLANLGGVCSSFIYRDPPRFHVGHGTIMGFLTLAILMTCLAMWDYNRLNKQKEKECLVRGITDDPKGEFRDAGDGSPLFRYMI
ncbi:major facilitator superfamily domain-containing protein [Chiua virens]|nr:major facilitator superfamily domain-containing protein [Chiua virens]